MAQKIIQTQTTAQVQQLSLAQVALSQMVELPLAQFAERVQNEMIDNEALEEADNERDAALDAAEPSADSARVGDDEGMDSGNTSEISVALGDYSSDDEVPDYLRERAERAETGIRMLSMTAMATCGMPSSPSGGIARTCPRPHRRSTSG